MYTLDIKYESGSVEGKFFVFQSDNNMINKSDIRDYSWEYTEQYLKIREFHKGLSTRTIPVTFFQRRNGEDGELKQAPQDMYAIFDRDVRSLKMGKLWINGYYVNCYITESKKKSYNNDVVISMDLTVLSDFRWHKEISRTFGEESAGGGGGGGEGFLDFEYDFEYDYGVSADFNSIHRLQSEAIAPFDFRIEWRGPIQNPEVKVGDNIYRVFTFVADGDVLVVDSFERAVYLIKPDNSRVSMFDNRDREVDNYIFDPMPVEDGKSYVVWPEGTVVRITGYIERSEPPWI